MPGFWRKCRITFRWLRIAVWLLVLAVLAGFIWCNRVGLPDFLKTRLVGTLHERGVELEFSRMRLSLIKGIVADNVSVGTGRNSGAATLTARTVRLQLDFPALWHRRLQLDGLLLRDGCFSLPLSPTNALTLTNLQTQLRFDAGDTWALEHFHADFAGAQIRVTGEVAHAPEAANWKLFSGTGTNRGAMFASLKDFSEGLKQIKFEGEPQLHLALSGDARDVHSILVKMDATAIGVRTPWFVARDFKTAAQLTAPDNVPTNTDESLGFWRNLQPFRLEWSAQLGELRSKKLNADNVTCAGGWAAPTFTVTNLVVGHLQAPWFETTGFRAEAGLTVSSNAPTNINPAWGFWTNLQPFRLEWSAQLDELSSPHLEGKNIACSGSWAAPTLTLNRLALRLGGGRLTASAALNVADRTLAITNDSDFDLQLLSPWLPEKFRQQLARITWSGPPVIHATGSVRLPPWTNAVKDWHSDIESSLRMRSEVAFTNAVVAGANLDRVHARIGYADLLWDLPELTVKQGRTQLQISGQESDATKNFRCRLSGELDAASVRQFLTTSNAVHGFGLLTFHKPLALTLDVAGNLRTLETMTATGRLALADFAIRGQTLDQVTADVAYSNLTVQFFQPRLARAGGAQHLAADRVTLDLAGERLFIYCGAGSMDPAVIGRAIGPKTAADMAPYEFLETPTARVSGCIPIKQKDGEVVQDDADLRVEIVGTAHFRWRKFETPAISGTIHWWNHNLILTNAVSECYGGEARGWGTFDLRPEIVGTDFSFDVTGTNVDLHRMGLALWSPTNQLEGTLSGAVTVTRANSSDWRSWNGYGQAHLRDGLLWDVPIFAFMSPVLNAVLPGLGNSRAKEAAAEFVISNGVIATDSLLIQSTMMRLQYSGTVDLRQNVNARVTAQLLRNTPVVGSLVSVVLWPVSKVFECGVTGHLEDPIVKPIYIPSLLLKPLLLPLHPIRTLEELFSPSSKGTNAPPAN